MSRQSSKLRKFGDNMPTVTKMSRVSKRLKRKPPRVRESKKKIPNSVDSQAGVVVSWKCMAQLVALLDHQYIDYGKYPEVIKLINEITDIKHDQPR